MENENTEYKDGDHNSFIEYVFTEEPKSPDTIKLELGSPQDSNNINKHIFEQLLQIFTDGMKYLYSDDNKKIDIASLEIDSIIKMKDYFTSFGVELIFDIYNQQNYIIKPYIYNSPELYNKSKSIDEFYYEIPVTLEKELFIYRIGFRL